MKQYRAYLIEIYILDTFKKQLLGLVSQKFWQNSAQIFLKIL